MTTPRAVSPFATALTSAFAVLCLAGASSAQPFAWRSATPESQGMSKEKLDALKEDLARRKTRAFLADAAQSPPAAGQFRVQRRGAVGIHRSGLDAQLGQLAPIGQRLAELCPCRVVEAEHHREMAKDDYDRQIGARDAIAAEIRLVEIIGKIQRLAHTLGADRVEDEAEWEPNQR